MLILAVLFGLCWGGFILVKDLFIWFSSLENEVAIVSLFAFTAILVFGSSIITKYFERMALIRNEHREKKMPIYEEFMSFWLKVLFSEKFKRKPPSEEEIIRFHQDFTQEIILWGSDPLLKTFTDFKSFIIENGESVNEASVKFMLLFEECVFEMRKDLGLKNKALALKEEKPGKRRHTFFVH